MLIMADLIALILCGAATLTVNEYKARIEALGKHAYRIAMSTSIALVCLSYVVYSSSALPAAKYAKVVDMYEDVQVVEVRSKKHSQLKHVHAFYEVLDNNPKELSCRQFTKLKAEYRKVMYSGK